MIDFKIKPELKEEWIKVAGRSACDPYSFGCLIATCASFEILDSDEWQPEEAIKVWTDRDLDLTGYMAGSAASMISRFHIRGDEFRKVWNARYGVDEEKAQGGTVNPAIVTIDT